MATKQSSDLVEELMCPVCLDLFRCPVTLECGHNYCRSCIDKVWDRERNPSCPECRDQLPARKYAVNRLLANVVRKVGKSNLDQKIKKSDQSPEPHTAERVVQFCVEHEERLKLFCKEDETLICVICRDSPKHSCHSFLPLQDAVGMYKDKLRTVSAPLGSRVKELIELQYKQEYKISDIKGNARNLEQHIKSEFAKLIQFLQDKEQKLVQQLKEDEAKILKEMKENLKSIKQNISTIQEAVSNIQSRLGQQDSLAFLTAIKGFTEKFSNDQQNDDECGSDGSENTESKNSVVGHDPSLGMYKGPLQYSVWKDMKSIISPSPSRLTLDPNTAHPILVLSEDLTSVQRGDKIQQLPDNPERFDVMLAVLGSEGFKSGRHYWEVEVGDNRTWAIGAVGESFNRKGDDEDIPTVPDSGFWLLMREENEWFVLDYKAHKLDMEVKPQKIGVYLDYEGGQVSLYNADDMSHLHTCHDTFTERLYPIIQTGDKTPVRLFRLKV